MVYNLYFFRKTKSEKAIPFRHLIATSLSSSSLDHILAPLPHTLLHPSTQRTWIKKEVGRSPTASQSVKGSKQTDTRYLKDLLHRGYTTVSGSYGLSMSACQREGGRGQTYCRSELPSPQILGLSRCFRSWSKHPCQNNRTFSELVKT